MTTLVINCALNHNCQLITFPHLPHLLDTLWGKHKPTYGQTQPYWPKLCPGLRAEMREKAISAIWAKLRLQPFHLANHFIWFILFPFMFMYRLPQLKSDIQ